MFENRKLRIDQASSEGIIGGHAIQQAWRVLYDFSCVGRGAPFDKLRAGLRHPRQELKAVSAS